MKEKIHPKYEIATVTCACGNTFQTRSTLKNIKVEICSNCHPFYTLTTARRHPELIDTAGRVDKFYRKYKIKPANQQ